MSTIVQRLDPTPLETDVAASLLRSVSCVCHMPARRVSIEYVTVTLPDWRSGPARRKAERDRTVRVSAWCGDVERHSGDGYATYDDTSVAMHEDDI